MSRRFRRREGRPSRVPSMVKALLLLLAANSLSAGSSATANTPKTATDFQTSIAAIETRTGGRIGVAAVDTSSGKRLDHRSQERFPMCRSEEQTSELQSH